MDPVIDFQKTILLVEDNNGDEILIKKFFAKAFPSILLESAKSMGDAYTKYKGKHYNLLLLDLNLPDAYGPSTISEAKRYFSNMPIVVLTGMASDLTIDISRTNGAQAVFMKNKLETPEFSETINTFLK